MSLPPTPPTWGWAQGAMGWAQGAMGLAQGAMGWDATGWAGRTRR